MAVSEFPRIIDRGCGIDIHKDNVVATIKGKDIESETGTFLTYTSDLHDLCDWLSGHGISYVATESTGVY